MNALNRRYRSFAPTALETRARRLEPSRCASLWRVDSKPHLGDHAPVSGVPKPWTHAPRYGLTCRRHLAGAVSVLALMAALSACVGSGTYSNSSDDAGSAPLQLNLSNNTPRRVTLVVLCAQPGVRAKSPCAGRRVKLLAPGRVAKYVFQPRGTEGTQPRAVEATGYGPPRCFPIPPGAIAFWRKTTVTRLTPASC
jgi:hypothetical protein